MNGERRPFTITCLSRDPERGFWMAHVTSDGVTINVDRRYGSWHAVIGNERRELLPHIAAALQEKVRPTDNAERRERERAAEAAAAKAKGVGAGAA